MLRHFYTITARAIRGFARDGGVMMAGHLAFLGLLSLFPFVIFTISVAGLFGETESGQNAIILMVNALPDEVASVISKPIQDILGGAPKGVLTISALIALWTASSGLDAARMAVRRAFHWAEVQPIIKRRLQSTAIAAVAPLLVLAAMSIQVIGPALWSMFGGDNLFSSSTETLWRLHRLDIAPTMLLFLLAAAYFIFAPFRIRPIAVWPGAFVAAISWFSIANGLSLYLRNLADYQATYGSLAGTMVTLLFFFFLGLAFVFGAEVNAAVTESRSGSVTAPSKEAASQTQLRPDA
ncbi:MAG: YihY/virulence factor BrkB family protein [Sphingomonadales bacterium]